MSNTAKLFTKNATERMADKRMSHADLARAMKVKPPMVSKYLAGRSAPGLGVLEKFAVALDCAPWELIRPEGAEATPAPRLDTGELGEIIAALMQQPEQLEDVRLLLGLAKVSEKRKSRS